MTSLETLQAIAKDHPQVSDRVAQIASLPEDEREPQAQLVLHALWSAL